MTDLLASGHVVIVAFVPLDVWSLRIVASLIEALETTPFLCFLLRLAIGMYELGFVIAVLLETIKLIWWLCFAWPSVSVNPLLEWYESRRHVLHLWCSSQPASTSHCLTSHACLVITDTAVSNPGTCCSSQQWRLLAIWIFSLIYIKVWLWIMTQVSCYWAL